MLPCGGSRRQSLIILAFFTLLLVVLFYHHDDLPDVPRLRAAPPPKAGDRLAIQPVTTEDLAKVHLLLPASSGQINLCKTLLTAAVLGYPVPTLLSRGETFDNKKLIGGGRYLAKIDRVLEWLEAQPEANNDNLVIIADAYGGFNYHANRKGMDTHMEGDIWFQLPLEVLIQRYHAVNQAANMDLVGSMGLAYKKEHIKQTILFGSSKRCTPSDPESSACYPIPDSPLPPKLYGKYTDDLKLNHTTHRQRYLSSAYTIGPVGDMRAMFRRASEKAARARDSVNVVDPDFDAFLELGSDQAIFHHMLGEQEYQREVMRRRYGEKPRGRTVVEGAAIDDILDPVMPHEVLSEKADRSDEFGMGLDYWSDLGTQTALNEDDARWLTYRGAIPEQMLSRPRQTWSCTPHVEGVLPDDLLNSTGVPRAAVSDASQFSVSHGWDEVPLYTNVCLDTVPVIVNHNGDRAQRERDWPEMWLQPHGRQLIEEMLDREEGGSNGEIRGGAYDGPGGHYHRWGELCPSTVEKELYRDFYDGP